MQSHPLLTSLKQGGCPEPSELLELITGRLSAARHDELEEHVVGCAHCRQTVELVDEPSDPLIDRMVNLEMPPVPTDRQFHDAVKALKSSASEEDRPRLMNGDLTADSTVGEFRIVRELGRGGMGTVYEAEQIALGRRVALKTLSIAPQQDGHRPERFQQEARAAALLQHPHIVSVYSAGIDNGVHYLAMQLVDGRNLSQVIGELRQRRLSSDKSIPPLSTADGETWPVGPSFSWIAQVGIQAAQAIQHAHEQGIVHRDIKPSNLMIDGAGNVFVTDFGIAKVVSEKSLTLTGDVLGTVQYLSPEQVSGNPATVDHRTDIHGLGLTLYELVTLQPCFAGREIASILQRVLSEKPRPPRTINPLVPADLETIILKAIAKDPADRYATAADLAHDLQRFLEGVPVRDWRLNTFKRKAARAWQNRYPAMTALGIVAMLCCIMIPLVVGLASSNQSTSIDATVTAASDEQVVEELLQGSHFFLRTHIADSPLGKPVYLTCDDDFSKQIDPEDRVRLLPAGSSGPRLEQQLRVFRKQGAGGVRSGDRILFATGRKNELNFHHSLTVEEDRIVVDRHATESDDEWHTILKLIEGPEGLRVINSDHPQGGIKKGDRVLIRMQGGRYLSRSEKSHSLPGQEMQPKLRVVDRPSLDEHTSREIFVVDI